MISLPVLLYIFIVSFALNYIAIFARTLSLTTAVTCLSIMKIILQLAESGSFFIQVDLFKVRGKYALTDAYEDHFALPKGRIILITHRRVVLLQVSWLI